MDGREPSQGVSNGGYRSQGILHTVYPCWLSHLLQPQASPPYPFSSLQRSRIFCLAVRLRPAGTNF